MLWIVANSQQCLTFMCDQTHVTNMVLDRTKRDLRSREDGMARPHAGFHRFGEGATMIAAAGPFWQKITGIRPETRAKPSAIAPPMFSRRPCSPDGR